MPNFDQNLFNSIMEKGKESWTAEDAAFIDYIFCLTQNAGGQIQPYQTLPSGNYLHNPAQKTIKSGADMATDLINNAGQRGDAWMKGMANPSRDPIKAALDSEAKYDNNTKKALAEKKWSKALAKVSHADIMKTVNKLGSSVFTTGLAAREDKVKAAFNELQPKLQAVSNAVQAMPNGTDADREARMVSNLKLMRKIGSS